MIELKVHNHPGVMAHITGLFSRRAFNLDGILCYPEKDDDYSRMILWVKDDSKIDQMNKQLESLYDVVNVKNHKTEDMNIFSNMAQNYVPIHYIDSFGNW